MSIKNKPKFHCRKSVFGVATFDSPLCLNDESIRVANKIWRDMLMRCYDKGYKERNPSYSNCLVCKDWLVFSKFKEWFDKNYIEGYHLDKDILFKGNKTYEPSKCCFVPPEINLLLIKRDKKRGDCPIGVYKNKHGRYCACIRFDGLSRHLGLFDTPKEAFVAYKTVKEKRIKEIADKFKMLGKITTEVYKALYNYQVLIND